jgi:hypothetical protein
LKRWLTWKNGTILDLAKAIRDKVAGNGFPILGDALEEAGCTNLDLLDSCRQGVPESDGIWALKILLGKEF